MVAELIKSAQSGVAGSAWWVAPEPILFDEDEDEDEDFMEDDEFGGDEDFEEEDEDFLEEDEEGVEGEEEFDDEDEDDEDL
jgi:hypothetical protein